MGSLLNKASRLLAGFVQRNESKRAVRKAFGGEWDTPHYARAFEKLRQQGIVTTPTLGDALTLRQIAAEHGVRTTVHGNGRRWYVQRVREELVGSEAAPAGTGAER